MTQLRKIVDSLSVSEFTVHVCVRIYITVVFRFFGWYLPLSPVVQAYQPVVFRFFGWYLPLSPVVQAYQTLVDPA